MKNCYRNWDISQFLKGQDFYISWAPIVQRRLDMIGVPVSEVCLLLRHDGMVFCFAERPRFLGNGMDIDGHLGNLDILDLGWKRFWLPTIFHQQKAGWFWLYQQSRLGATVMVSLLVQLSSCGSWGWRPGCEPLRPQKRIRNSSARQLGGGTVPSLPETGCWKQKGDSRHGRISTITIPCQSLWSYPEMVVEGCRTYVPKETFIHQKNHEKSVYLKSFWYHFG